MYKPGDVRMRSGRKWFLYVCIFHYIRDRDGLKYIIFCLCAPGIVLRFILNFCCGVHFPLFSWAYTLIRSRREQLCLLKCKFPLGAAGPDCGTQRVKRLCVCVCEERQCVCVCVCVYEERQCVCVCVCVWWAYFPAWSALWIGKMWPYKNRCSFSVHKCINTVHIPFH